MYQARNWGGDGGNTPQMKKSIWNCPPPQDCWPEDRNSAFKGRYLSYWPGLSNCPGKAETGFNTMGFRTQCSFKNQSSRIPAFCIKFLPPPRWEKTKVLPPRAMFPPTWLYCVDFSTLCIVGRQRLTMTFHRNNGMVHDGFVYIYHPRQKSWNTCNSLKTD